MPKINQDLLEKLRDRLDIGQARVYQLVNASARANRIPRHLAALLVAADNGLSFQKYASSQDMLDLRGIQSSHVSVTPPAVPTATPSQLPRRDKVRKLTKTKENTVFVVHGRDSKLRDAMYQFLGALGLQPQEWGHAIRSVRRKGGNPYVNDAVNKIMEQAEAIIVLLTPDDEVRLKEQFCYKEERKTEGKLQDQARPNVIFETGIAIGAYHRKTVIVRVGKVKEFSDIGGMHILQMNGTSAQRNELANRLEDLGCTISKDGDHWLRAGEFTPTPPKKKR